LFIAGAARSGSTLLDRVIGKRDGFCSTGELQFIWRRSFREDQLCGCGVSFTSALSGERSRSELCPCCLRRFARAPLRGHPAHLRRTGGYRFEQGTLPKCCHGSQCLPLRSTCPKTRRGGLAPSRWPVACACRTCLSKRSP